MRAAAESNASTWRNGAEAYQAARLPSTKLRFKCPTLSVISQRRHCEYQNVILIQPRRISMIGDHPDRLAKA
jgi:hypothetical protein